MPGPDVPTKPPEDPPVPVPPPADPILEQLNQQREERLQQLLCLRFNEWINPESVIDHGGAY